MPTRLRIPIYRTGLSSGDLGRLLLPAHEASLDKAARALEAYFEGKITAVLVESGRVALRLALDVLGIAGGDEVVVSSFNCPQVIEAALDVGAEPVLCDSSPTDGAPTAEALERALSSRTRCIILTHQFGSVADSTSAIRAVAREHGLAVIDDAAQALGARAFGLPAGLMGDVGVISFGRTKPLNCFGGGALLVPTGLERRIEQPAWCDSRGLRREALKVTWQAAAWSWPWPVQIAVGAANMRKSLCTDVAEALSRRRADPIESRRMPALGATLLASRIATLDSRVETWQARGRSLAELLTGLPVELPRLNECESTNAYFPIRVPSGRRYDLGAHLASKGIQTSWFHYPLHLQQRYVRFGRGKEFPGTEQLSRQVLNLPCRWLDMEELADVARASHEFFAE
jgi:perosamine synthetase